MEYDIIEGLSYDEVLSMYDNLIEDSVLITDRLIYATRVDCDNGIILNNVSFCTFALGYDNATGYTRNSNVILDWSKSVGGQVYSNQGYSCSCAAAGCYATCRENEGCIIVGTYNGYCGEPNNN